MRDRFQIKSSVIHEKFDDETVIVNLDTGCYFNLQSSADLIWTLVAAGCTERDIVDRVCRLYRGDTAAMTVATNAFLERLLAEALVERTDEGGNEAAPEIVVPYGDFVVPELQKYTDMEELLLLDPIHEVDKLGWPSAKPRRA